jgi:hypothetical protein
MAAVPIYVWNGTAWQETGPVIPASPIKYQASAPTSPSTGDIWIDSDADVTTGSQQFQRFRFVASGGETSISGVDANGATLAYTAGTEIVVLNGSTLVRGQDYTATNGTSITGLSPALVASDVLEVFSFMAFNVANTYTQSQADGLFVPKSAGGLELLSTTTLSGTSTVVSGISQAYKKLIVIVKNIYPSSGAGYIVMRPNSSGSTRASLYGVRGTAYITNQGTDLSFEFGGGIAAGSINSNNIFRAEFPFYSATDHYKQFTMQGAFLNNSLADRTSVYLQGVYESNSAIDSVQFFSQYSLSSGTMQVYGEI